MASSTRATRTGTKGSTRRLRALILAVAILLAGCANKVVTIPTMTKSETEIAVESVRSGLLVRCDGPSGPAPTNETGNLLLDYVEIAGLLAQCIERHDALVDVIEPIVQEEKARTSTVPKTEAQYPRSSE